MIQFLLRDKGVKLIMVPNTKLYESIKLDEETRKLYYNGKEISVVYFRISYLPIHVAKETDWKAREMIELS